MVEYSESFKNAVRDTYRQTRCFIATSTQHNIPKTTVRRWCHEIAETVAPEHRLRRKKLREFTIRIRREERTTGIRKTEEWAKEIGLSKDSINKMLTGVLYKELNHIEPPVFQTTVKKEAQAKAQEMCREGVSYKNIAKALNVSLSSVSLWCKGLRPQRAPHPEKAKWDALREKAKCLYAEGKTVVEIEKLIDLKACTIRDACKDLIAEKRRQYLVQPKPYRHRRDPTVDPRRRLFDADVIEMREEVHRVGVRDLNKYAKRYDASCGVISLALRGLTFEHLNEEHPPVTQKLPKVGDPVKSKKQQREELITEVIALHKSDPTNWTFRKLAVWMNEKTGKGYGTKHIVGLLKRHDDELREFIKNNPYVRPVKTKKRTAPRQLTQEQKEERVRYDRERRANKRQQVLEEEEKKKQEALALQRLDEAEREYEKAMRIKQQAMDFLAFRNRKQAA